MLILEIALAVCVFGLVAAVALLLRKAPAAASTDLSVLSTPLQHVAHAVQQQNAHTAVLAEKLTQLENLHGQATQAVHQQSAQTLLLTEKLAQVEATQNRAAHIAQQHSAQTAIIAEKLTQVETVQGQAHSAIQSIGHGLTQTGTITQGLNRALGEMRTVLAQAQNDMTALTERVSTVDGKQNRFGQDITSVGHQLTQSGTVTQGLAEAANMILTEISSAKNDLARMHAQAQARHEVEQKSAASIQRLESLMAGTHTKGAAGENILDAMFARLPTEWQVRNFRVNDRACEFGLRLSNNLILPVDSKWAATQLLEQFAASEDVAQQQKLKEQIETAVLIKAREVKKYIDPNLTVNFGVAAVPDAVFEVCRACQSEALGFGVVVIPYSMFLPYLMLVFHLVVKSTQSIDLEKLDRELSSMTTTIGELQEEVEGRFSRAITMLTNSRADTSARLSRINSRLVSLQLQDNEPVEPRPVLFEN